MHEFLDRAGIPRLDARWDNVDIHSMRQPFASRLARSGLGACPSAEAARALRSEAHSGDLQALRHRGSAGGGGGTAGAEGNGKRVAPLHVRVK